MIFSIGIVYNKVKYISELYIMAEKMQEYWKDEPVFFSECKILYFDEPGEAWLDFVSDNRSGNYEGESYDSIFGPVADDDVYRTFTLYTAGLLTKEQTLEQLKIKKLYNQLVLTTEKALSYLQFAGTVPEEEM